MLSKTRRTTAYPPPPGAPSSTITQSGRIGPPSERDATAPASTAAGGETRGARWLRQAHRARLHGSAILTVALIGFLIALAVSNTASVKVDWVFGSAHVSLVWLVLFAAILGWLLGLVVSARFQWLTRAPRRAADTR